MSKDNTSADEQLREEILTEFKQVHKLAPADYTENCTNVVMSIIRTEKLKLLAEVRERVVGEDESAYSEDLTRYFEHIFHQNNLRTEQRENLTKLEEEL